MKNLSCLLSLLLLVAACREPSSLEEFIPAPGPYEFQVEMSDTTVSYDFSFFTRLDGYPSDLQAAHELPLRITWISPSDSSYTENVYMPLSGRSSMFSRQVFQPYRAHVRPVQPGLWTLRVAIPYADGREILRGLGLVVAQSSD